MCDLARKFAVCAVVSALLTQVAYAQGLPDMQELPESGRQKAAEELKKAQEKAARGLRIHGETGQAPEDLR